MLFFMRLLKVTPPHKRCFELGTSNIPSAILLHNSPTSFSWCPASKTMAEEFSCLESASKKTKCKEGFFLFSWWGLFLAELSFQTEPYEGQDRAACCKSITLLLFGGSQRTVIPVSELIKVILRKTYNGCKRWFYSFFFLLTIL